ncbi:hypothetical protein ACLI09_10465 [Flavobacterium sp. RHBU_24]|uniref:hypothetical protein n=1 Tax=Flavobacterium sp. RHBU_24 TaxID=3391185 RepID=UPI00398504F9
MENYLNNLEVGELSVTLSFIPPTVDIADTGEPGAVATAVINGHTTIVVAQADGSFEEASCNCITYREALH